MRSRPAAILLVLPLLVLLTLPARAAGLRDVINALELPFKDRKIQDYSADFFQQSQIASLNRMQRARGEVSVRFEGRQGGKVPTVMFHWEYREPTRQEIISDGKTLWVYLPENNQVIQSDIEMVSQARENDPMTFLTGLGNLSRDFTISWAEPNRDVDGNYVLDLRPKRTTALLNRMVIVVDRYAVEETPAGTTATPAEEAAPRRPPPRHGPSSDIPKPDEFFGKASGSGSISQARGGLVFPILSTTVYDPNGNSTAIEFSNLRVNRGISAMEFRFIQPAGVEVVRPTGKEMGF